MLGLLDVLGWLELDSLFGGPKDGCMEVEGGKDSDGCVEDEGWSLGDKDDLLDLLLLLLLEVFVLVLLELLVLGSAVRLLALLLEGSLVIFDLPSTSAGGGGFGFVSGVVRLLAFFDSTTFEGGFGLGFVFGGLLNLPLLVSFNLFDHDS